jgi:hypothetical protein
VLGAWKVEKKKSAAALLIEPAAKTFEVRFVE